MTTDRSSASRGSDPDAPPQTQRLAQEVDIKLLAEKVYRLLLADVRLAQARGDRLGRGRIKP
ncbi:hypothetical protein EKD04_024970 [Chloroflexales bacterium ZM16-3]|nr:hypothetical protein [Chloroflexales bacterium ZM16-3]